MGEIIETRRPLSEGRVDHFYDLLLREKEPKEGGPVKVEPLAASGTSAGSAARLVLALLKQVENVNALAREQEIEFNPRMTVLFGENASAKTGYVRILKQVAAVRTAETIMPNIHAPGTDAAPTRASATDSAMRPGRSTGTARRGQG